MFRGLFEVLRNNRGEVDTAKKPTLAEADDETIAKQAYLEIEAESKGVEPESIISKPEEEETTETETKNPDEEPENTEDNTEGEKDDKDESEEGTDKTEKPEDDKSKSEETKPVIADEKIVAHAEKHGMTHAEAKEDLEKTEEILKQFKNDPVEMARAMRNKDREYYKLRQEHEKSTKQKTPVFKRVSDEQFIAYAKNALTKPPEEHKNNPDWVHPYINKYKERFPAKSELMSDEAIVEEIAEQELKRYHEKAIGLEAGVKKEAETKRTEFLNNIAPADRSLLPEVKEYLSKVSDEVILGGEFDANNLLTMAKGKRYDADVKAAFERGLKQAKEGAEIIGVKGASSGGVKLSGKKTLSSTLSKRQREIAEEMYPGDSVEESYKFFADTFSDELEKDKGFIPWKS